MGIIVINSGGKKSGMSSVSQKVMKWHSKYINISMSVMSTPNIHNRTFLQVVKTTTISLTKVYLLTLVGCTFSEYNQIIFYVYPKSKSPNSIVEKKEKKHIFRSRKVIK